MRQQPTNAQIADGFERVANGLEKAPAHTHTNLVEMDNVNASQLLNSCGSSACHGGWIAFAAYTGCIQGYKYRGRIKLPYTAGAEVLAELCGFTSLWSRLKRRLKAKLMRYTIDYEGLNLLQRWAADNPKLWGNSEGYWIFQQDRAFEIKGQKVRQLTLQDIIAHYRRVAARLRARAEAAS